MDVRNNYQWMKKLCGVSDFFVSVRELYNRQDSLTRHHLNPLINLKN